MQGKKTRLTLACAVSLVCLGAMGCSQKPVDTDNILVLQQEEENVKYSITVATVSDVRKVQKIDCVYEQAEAQDLSFDIDGKKVAEVYIEEGDTVEKGQLLASLDMDSIDTELNEIRYWISRNEILLSQTRDNMELAIERLSLNDASSDDIASVTLNYEYQIEDYEDLISVQNIKLEELENCKSKQCIYAGMSGTVSYVKDNLKDSYTTEGEKVITIIDDSKCLFYSDQMQYSSLFQADTAYEMEISGKSMTCRVMPDEMEAWEERMQFVLSEMDENMELGVGSLGKIEVVLEERKNVLTLPAKAVHRANSECYVYVIGENNLRETKWISIGLEGKDTVEITDGLKEGDKVILK